MLGYATLPDMQAWAEGIMQRAPEGTFLREAGQVVDRPADALHRLEVIPGERAISLFITGPKVREWGFACDHGWVHWQDFTSAQDSSRTGRGCGEHGDFNQVRVRGTLEIEVEGAW